jgi:hypothetical protein
MLPAAHGLPQRGTAAAGSEPTDGFAAAPGCSSPRASQGGRRRCSPSSSSCPASAPTSTTSRSCLGSCAPRSPWRSRSWPGGSSNESSRSRRSPGTRSPPAAPSSRRSAATRPRPRVVIKRRRRAGASSATCPSAPTPSSVGAAALPRSDGRSGGAAARGAGAVRLVGLQARARGDGGPARRGRGRCRIGRSRRVWGPRHIRDPAPDASALPRPATSRGHKTDTSETTRATPRDVSPDAQTARFAGEMASPMIPRARA